MLRTSDSFGPQGLATARAVGRQAGWWWGSHYGRFGHSAGPKPTRPKLKIISYLPPRAAGAAGKVSWSRVARAVGAAALAFSAPPSQALWADMDRGLRAVAPELVGDYWHSATRNTREAGR